MVAINNTPKLLADITERAVLTYVEAFLGILLAAGTTNVITLSAFESAGIAAIPAGLAVVKGAVGSLLGRSGTASWLPAKSDPASTAIS
ncbi:holin [Streptomyces sp. CA-135486]|uniref:holin n=1 Tax=Streptomyces sp. CA-135486 TaxID=3240049 RepID=UPI003D8E12FA